MFLDLISGSTWTARQAGRVSLGPLPGSATSACLAELGSVQGLVVAITPDTAAAARLERELRVFVDGPVEVLNLPDRETLPYDNFSPHEDIVSDRLRALARLPTREAGILIVPIPTLMQRLPPRGYISASSLLLAVGDTLDPGRFRQYLGDSGYRAVETVYEHGEYALRGSLLDLFPMGSNVPFRIDLLDDEIDSLRTFDPESQRTVERVDRIELLPAREFPLNADGIERFKLNWYREMEGDPDRCATFREIADARAPGGCEYYLPLFFDRTDTLFDYLPEGTRIVALDGHYEAASRYWGEIEDRYREFGIDPDRPLLRPERLFQRVDELYGALRALPMLELRASADAPVHFEAPFIPPPALEVRPGAGDAAARLGALLASHRGPVLLCAESDGRREILREALLPKIGDLPEVRSWPEFLRSGATMAIMVGDLDRGLYLGPDQPCVVAEAQLFGERVAQRRRRHRQASPDPEAVFRDLTELRTGAPVVHLEHGVGRYEGLQSLEVDGSLAEFLTLRYQDDARLYVPVASLHLISRYTGTDPELAPLHRLGSEQWDKARRKAAEKVSDVAAQLLEVYARRETRSGRVFATEGIDYEAFCDAFPFEETEDQRTAIDAVLSDLRAEKVMDRLVCGDVGFGKTEVAMRAAFVAARNGAQVAMLVPTTLLAEQHHASFSDRFAGWDIAIEVVSRFKSAREVEAVSQRLESGETSIVIGTHKLLQSNFRFRDLGLLIIDEEHRFGVKQKEAIKALRTEVDILTLTATPIPRTLNMALEGMRDLSIIATPPARRLSIKTFVREHNIALVKEAILRETLRGGQVFFLHNEVKTIEEQARKLRELVPGLSVAVAHGQLRESELERVMSDFYHKRHHILVCSTIIETGIDIPNANTIVIERADRFGLAQLHQLRGRVGRSHHQAYAYLLTPPKSALTRDAEKRLEAIEAAGDLGAGYLLATHDLEIRGAGEILGDDQSGQIAAVGFSLYSRMLESAVAALRRGELPDADAPLEQGTEVKLHMPALIPEDYLPDTNARLVLYKRIAAADSEHTLRELQVEMIDRFGLLPQPVRNLFDVTRIRMAAQRLGIRSLDFGPGGGSIEFSERTAIDPANLVSLVQSDPRRYRLTGATRLRIEESSETGEQRREAALRLLARLGEGVDADAA